MKITLSPKTTLGKIAAFLSIAFIILISLKIRPGIPISTFAIAGIGMVGFVIGVVSIIKKDRSIGNFLSIAVGLVIISWLAGELSSSAGLFKDFPVKKSLTAAEAGRVRSEVVNFGSVSQRDGWIYYVYEDYLYKRKWDWAEKTKVSENKVALIYISGDWIYYQDSPNGGALYKMKTDGSEQTRICNDQVGSFAVSGEWIYYDLFKTAEVKMSSDALYRIRTDGSGKMKLADVKWAENLKVQGDWLYYDYLEENNKRVTSSLYRIKTDGTENSLILKDSEFVYLSGEWGYYLVSNEGKDSEKITIYRIKEDGTERSEITTLSQGNAPSLYDDWFYYSSGKGLSRMKLDGTEKEKLNDICIWSLIGISGDWMYIQDYGGPMFRVKLDGSVGTRLN
jgi:hypothetical protein